MTALIPVCSRIIAGKPTPVVDARKLHAQLRSKRQFANWIKEKREKWRLTENKDFLTILSKTPNGRPRKEYFLTIDTGKKIAMAENSVMGDNARDYFLECEKQLKSKPEQLKLESSASLIQPGRYVVRIHEDGSTYLDPISENLFITNWDSLPKRIEESMYALDGNQTLSIIRACTEKLEKIAKIEQKG